MESLSWGAWRAAVHRDPLKVMRETTGMDLALIVAPSPLSVTLEELCSCLVKWNRAPVESKFYRGEPTS